LHAILPLSAAVTTWWGIFSKAQDEITLSRTFCDSNFKMEGGFHPFLLSVKTEQ